MIEDTFAFIIHPIQIKKDAERKVPIARYLNEKQINFLSRFFPPLYISEITGLTSVATGRELRGWLIAVPYTPPTMLALPIEEVYRKIVACGHLAEKLGARILGLGAYTSVVGDGGITIADRLDIPVTNGDSYTIQSAVSALVRAGAEMGVYMHEAKVAVVGATGATGKACARLIAEQCAELVLVGRRQGAVEVVRDLCAPYVGAITATTDMNAIYDADLILTVTSAIHAVIEPRHLKPGAVVCDVARPRDVSVLVAEQRDDVLVIEGGMVEVPGPVDFHFDFGFPPGMAYACMAETMALAFEGRYEDYTLGRDISLDQVREISAMADRHGFRLAGFRSFGHAVTPAQIDRVRERASRTRKTWSPAIG